MTFDIDAVAERLAGIISDKQDQAGCALACSTLEVVIAEELKPTRKATLLDAAKDVCMYCSGHAPNFLAAEPANNGSGNWVHRHKEDTDGISRTLCKATGIHSRIRYEEL